MPRTASRLLAEKAARFRALHKAPSPLVLPNAWDVASARIVEAAGFPAIATTSAGIAFSLGYRDGEQITRDEMLLVVARIARAVSVPVSADMEAGYGNRPEDMARLAVGLVRAGAVGLNLEDSVRSPVRGLADLSLQTRKIRALRESAAKAGVPLFINARVDTYLISYGDPEARFAETVRRARAYREAGADCIYPIDLRDLSTIRRLVSELAYPINILAGPGAPSLAELERAGVRRASFGSGPMGAAMAVVCRIARELRERGGYEALRDAMTHNELTQLFPPAGRISPRRAGVGPARRSPRARL
jgi:2-methylisocitrate lyase-like PEP mutase family enzyme